MRPIHLVLSCAERHGRPHDRTRPTVEGPPDRRSRTLRNDTAGFRVPACRSAGAFDRVLRRLVAPATGATLDDVVVELRPEADGDWTGKRPARTARGGQAEHDEVRGRPSSRSAGIRPSPPGATAPP